MIRSRFYVPWVLSCVFTILIVRGHVKYFRKSPVRNDDFLQPEMISHFNHWLSIKFACETIGRPFELSNEDIEKLKELSNILSIFELAVNHLSRRDSNLIEFERVIKFTLKNYKILKLLLPIFSLRKLKLE